MKPESLPAKPSKRLRRESAETLPQFPERSKQTVLLSPQPFISAVIADLRDPVTSITFAQIWSAAYLVSSAESSNALNSAQPTSQSIAAGSKNRLMSATYVTTETIATNAVICIPQSLPTPCPAAVALTPEQVYVCRPSSFGILTSFFPLM